MGKAAVFRAAVTYITCSLPRGLLLRKTFTHLLIANQCVVPAAVPQQATVLV